MSDSASPTRLSFEENVSTLLEELLLAAKWQRPSILLAVHKTKFGQDKAEKSLEDQLRERGYDVLRITVDRDHSDVPHQILSASAPERSIFYVSNIDWGGGEDRRDAYRALNIYREIFVDHHIKAVFWLTLNEAAGLARHAPDFWAFRHRVVEFTGQRLPVRVSLPAGVLLWDVLNGADAMDSLDARVAVRQDLLDRLPGNSEARSARIDLLYNLGYLHWLMGRSDKASEEFRAALDLAGNAHLGRIKSSLWNGLAVIAYEHGEYPQAAELLEQAVRESPNEAGLLMNQGATACALGRNTEALTIARKAVKAMPRDPRLWGAFGYLHAAMGRFDEAIAGFSRAVALAPKSALHHAALAICYDLVGRSDETVRHFELARMMAHGKMLVYLDICEAALLGDASVAMGLARTAIHTRHLSLQELQRDPNLSLVWDASQLREFAD